jgi:hypothetical protein
MAALADEMAELMSALSAARMELYACPVMVITLGSTAAVTEPMRTDTRVTPLLVDVHSATKFVMDMFLGPVNVNGCPPRLPVI